MIEDSPNFIPTDTRVNTEMSGNEVVWILTQLVIFVFLKENFFLITIDYTLSMILIFVTTTIEGTLLTYLHDNITCNTSIICNTHFAFKATVACSCNCVMVDL